MFSSQLFKFVIHKDKQIDPQEKSVLYDSALVDLNFQRIDVSQYTDEELLRMWKDLEIFTDSEYRNARRRKTPFEHTCTFNIKKVRDNFQHLKLGLKRSRYNAEIPESIRMARDMIILKKAEETSRLYDKGHLSYILNESTGEPLLKKKSFNT